MKILMTGHRGQVGKWALEHGAFDGDEVVGYDIQDGDDIFDEEGLQTSMNGCDAVIHLAAHGRRELPIGAAEFMRLNVWGTAAVWNAAVQKCVGRFVYVSSGNVYCATDDFFRGRFERAEPVELDTVPDGTDPQAHAYVRSKLACERALANASEARDAPEVIALRINNLGGYRGQQPEWKGAYLRVDSLGEGLRRACYMPLPRRFVLLDLIEPNPHYASTEEMVSILYPEGYIERSD